MSNKSHNDGQKDGASGSGYHPPYDGLSQLVEFFIPTDDFNKGMQDNYDYDKDYGSGRDSIGKK